MIFNEIRESENFTSNPTTKKVFVKKEKMLLIMYSLILFSNSVLRTQEHLKLFIILSLIVCLFAFYKILVKPVILTRAVLNKFTTWLTLLFMVYFFYGLVLPCYDEFNADFFFFLFVMTFVTIILFAGTTSINMMEIFINSCAIVSILICFYIFANEWSIILEGGNRIGDSASGNVNTLAIYLGSMSIPCIFKVFMENKFKYLIPYILSVILIFMTGSKKGLLFIILGIAILSILKYGFKLYKYLIPILVGVLIIFLILNIEYFYNILGFRIIDFLGSVGFKTVNSNYSYSTNIRLLMMKLGYDAFLTKPLFGGGWFYFSYYSGLGTYSHNNFLELLTTYGLSGFILYYSIFIFLLSKLKKILKRDNYAKLLFGLIIVILVNDIAAVTFSYNIFNYQVLAIAYLYIRDTHKRTLIQQGATR